jgi:uncharacterized protein YwqG
VIQSSVIWVARHDEDTDARMAWGDGAIALWAIRREDLARRDFSSVYVIVDGH